ncbi:MAG: molybdopterin biosynthesis protein [Anaerolineales bacterium]|nr:MAG: molybdopterin biosynthesis protein [Anaerolineales bacterium]
MANNRHRSVFLQDVPLQEARSRFERALRDADLWEPLEPESIPLDQALGRISAEPVWAKISSPHYHAAAMDGYALRATETEGASDRNPVELLVGPQAQYIDTGDPLPEWANAVIPIEDLEVLSETPKPQKKSIRLMAPTSPWSNVRLLGEDMVATELVIPSGHELRPVDLGAIAASGHDHVLVWRKPRVAIIPTGTELRAMGKPVKVGEIIEFNSLVLASQIESWGGLPDRLPIVQDELERIFDAAANAAINHDLVLIIAGSSAGTEDFTADVVESLGTLLVHGIAVRPGHPVILGMIEKSSKSGSPRVEKSIPIIGVPGYPVSAALTGEIFVKPLLGRWLSKQEIQPEILTAKLARKVHSRAGDLEYLRVTVGQVGERWIASPLSRGAGVITSLVRADGIVEIPAGVQGIPAGEIVPVRLYRSRQELERTILALGSHDLTLDLLAQFLSLRGSRLSSGNLGSLGGLIALQRGEAHLAGSHLLDPETGEFNLPYIERYLPDVPVVVVRLVGREQGLILAPGNPKSITGLDDLGRPDLAYVNRQRGAGTRILLDYQLEQLGIEPASVRGYQHEEHTHLAVAAAVASGRADCGLGIHAAAAALDLDFLPLFQERYDLIIPKEHHESAKLMPLLQLLGDPEFQRTVVSLPGYSTDSMGEIIAVID